LCGEWAAIGSPAEGASVVHLYRYIGGQWCLKQTLRDPEYQGEDAFGQVCVINGDLLLVSDPLGNGRQELSGAVYVYRLDGDGAVFEAVLMASDGGAIDHFGWSIGVEGQTAVIGARDASADGVPQAGAAYIFDRDPSTRTWHEVQKLTPPNPQNQGLMGASVAISDGTVLVGSHGANAGAGVVYAYCWHSRKWDFTQELSAFDQAPDARFGQFVSILGDCIAVGAPRAATPFDPDGGAVYTFSRGSLEWNSQQKLFTANAIGSSPWFGWPVVITEHRGSEAIVIGSWGDDAAGNNAGAAYVFTLTGSEWREFSKIMAPDPEPAAAFPGMLSCYGDQALATASGDVGGTAYFLTGVAGVDCNSNETSDSCDILGGTSSDADGDQIPDECEPSADLNGDSKVDAVDLAILLGSWGTCRGQCLADLNVDMVVDAGDLSLLLGSWASD
jgi:hypothetical protein